MDISDRIKGLLFGAAIGDALGVPVEFKSREYLKKHPVTDMTGYGTHNQPPGTFSDDSSLTFCLAEVLTKDFDLNEIAANFVKWKNNNYWTATDRVFDIGIATSKAINNISKGIQPELAGGKTEYDNGNGSLMRISPLVFYLHGKPIQERFELVKNVSSITHAHIRSVISCFYYLEFMLQIMNEHTIMNAYHNLKQTIPDFLHSISIDQLEVGFLDGLLQNNIYEFPEENIESTGYVIHTLEASIWCLLTSDTFEQSVLKAVNLGDDTDTTGCVTGAIAGLYYGYKNMPQKWIENLLKNNEIENLSERLLHKSKTL